MEKLLTLSEDSSLGHLVIRLITDAGLRREEVVNLKVSHVGEKALRFAGKRGRERTVPMSAELKRALQPFCVGKRPTERVVGLKDKAIYMLIKRYGRMAGDPTLKPHDLRHYFCERLQEAGVPLRVIQELAGHESVETTQVYVGVTGDHLETAIRKMEMASAGPNTPDKPEEKPQPLRPPRPLKRIVESVEENAVTVDSLLKKPLPRIVESVEEE